MAEVWLDKRVCTGVAGAAGRSASRAPWKFSFLATFDLFLGVCLRLVSSCSVDLLSCCLDVSDRRPSAEAFRDEGFLGDYVSGDSSFCSWTASIFRFLSWLRVLCCFWAEAVGSGSAEATICLYFRFFVPVFLTLALTWLSSSAIIGNSLTGDLAPECDNWLMA